MNVKISDYKRKWSIFSKWVVSICIVVGACFIAYIVCDLCGVVFMYQYAMASNMDYVGGITVAIVLLIAFGYVLISLYNLLSHRADEDSRMHCLPIIYSPVFLILENGLLHLFDFSMGEDGEFILLANPYYSVTMTVISAVVVGVITFASLKFSFGISSQRSRFLETAKAKPNIKVTKRDDKKYVVKVENQNCYLSGVYVGKIDKILYRDIKRTGNMFHLRKMYFPNVKVLYKKDKTSEIDFSEFLDCDIKDLRSYADVEGQDIFLIFRDEQNYYYFAQLPVDDSTYNVIGVNEHTITRLIYKHNKWQYKYNKSNRLKSSNKAHNVVYESMDWFKIPYNFFPNVF